MEVGGTYIKSSPGRCRIETLERHEWRAAHSLRVGFANRKRMKGGRLLPTAGLMSLGGGRGQESIGRVCRVTSATRERTLSRSKTLKSGALARQSSRFLTGVKTEPRSCRGHLDASCGSRPLTAYAELTLQRSLMSVSTNRMCVSFHGSEVRPAQRRRRATKRG